MSDTRPQPEILQEKNDGASMFAGPKAEPSRRGLVMGVVGAAVVVVAIVAGVVAHGRKTAPAALNAELPADAYSASLAFTQLAMSQSDNLSGGSSTFLDGHVKNTGADTLTGVTMQVAFRNDEGMAPNVETLPLSLISMHQPYVDTEPVSAAPLKPGDEVEFRLIFETIPTNWNQQMPELRVVHVTKR